MLVVAFCESQKKKSSFTKRRRKRKCYPTYVGLFSVMNSLFVETEIQNITTVIWNLLYYKTDYCFRGCKESM